MKFKGVVCVSALAVLFALAAVALAVEPGYLWDGSQWKNMSIDLKTAYVKGICNMADFETAAAGPGQAPCISKGFVDELKTKSVGDVIAEVDKFYKENPTKENMAVVGVILQRCTKLCQTPAAGKK